MSTNSELLDHFIAVTQAPEDRARFYVEAAGGDLTLAIENFLEDERRAPVAGEVVAPKIFSNPVDMGDDDEDEDDDDDVETGRPRFGGAAAAGASGATSSKPKASGASSRIFTLGNMRDEDNDEEDDKGQAFYAGGSETSGQQIIGPSKKKNPEKLIKDLFESAKEHGAEEVHEDATKPKGPVVYGTGYRLGTGNEPTEVIQGPPRPKPPKVQVLKLWKNGFTVDDGPLRKFDDPANKEFLDAIRRGEPPRELLRQAEGTEVQLDLQDHRDEDFEPPKGKYVLYNDGYKLGSPTPNVVSNASPSDQAANEQRAKSSLGLNESQPTTQIQVRLSDGSRLVIKANHTHKVSDIRDYITTARPEYQGREFALLSGFPNKELTDNSLSLQAANLISAVVIQKLK